MDTMKPGADGSDRFIRRLYTIVKDEAREAQARRGLPFGGLFTPAGRAEGREGPAQH
jgi:hypothetical protein